MIFLFQVIGIIALSTLFAYLIISIDNIKPKQKLTIGDGWIAEVMPSIPASKFLELVRFSKGDLVKFARLDTGKVWFIDQTPVETTHEQRMALIGFLDNTISPLKNDATLTDLSETFKRLQPKLSLNEYQKIAVSMAASVTNSKIDIATFALGLTGESGEIADIIKKHVAQGHDLNVEKIKLECGDVLWYLAVLTHVLEIPLQDVLQANIDKLTKRYPN